MTKKKTVEEVRELFESRGFTLLSTEYKNNSSPLKYLCSKGHQTKICFGNLQHGQGCAECSFESRRKTIEEVRELFTARDYTLLSKDYQDSKTPLNYLCSNGHNATISLGSLHDGRGCAECAGLKKKTIEEVREFFTARGYTLLSTEYKNSSSSLNYICFQGHKCKISFHSLQSGRGCAECSFESKRKTIEEVRELFTTRGFTLVSEKYNGSHSPLNYLCSNDHNAMTSLDSLRSGHGCAECGGSKKKTLEEVKSEFNKRGFTLLSTEYKNALSPLNYVCDQGHLSQIRFNNLMNGNGCADCAETGFNPNKSAILYYLRFQYEGNFYYKIGITNNTPSKRFQSEKTAYTIVKETFYTLGKDAHTQEQAILKKFSASRYKGKPFLTMRGDTELFIKDVLQIDYEPLQNFAA